MAAGPPRALWKAPRGCRNTAQGQGSLAMGIFWMDVPSIKHLVICCRNCVKVMAAILLGVVWWLRRDATAASSGQWRTFECFVYIWGGACGITMGGGDGAMLIDWTRHGSQSSFGNGTGVNVTVNTVKLNCEAAE